MNEKNWPSPDEIQKRAREALNLNTLPDYLPTIRLLREDGWSYRRIASWLTEQGIGVTHNQVYYAIRDSLQDAEDVEALEQNRDAEDFEHLNPDIDS